MLSVAQKEIAREREKRAWYLRQRNWTQERIAQELGVSQMAVSKMLKRMTTRYFNNNLRNVKRVKREQVAQLDHMVDELYAAWEKSKEDAKQTTIKGTKDRGGDSEDEEKSKVKPYEVTKNNISQFGDVRYIAQIAKLKEDIRKILGIDAPIKTENTINFGEDVEFTLSIPNANKLADERESEIKKLQDNIEAKPESTL